jgi:hypothetical protein
MAISDAKSTAFLVAIALMHTPVFAQDAIADAENRSPRGCHPDIDPRTGATYPVCPRWRTNADATVRGDESAVIDITTDAYKRIAEQQHREGILGDEDFAHVMDRVRQGRIDARLDSAQAASGE